MSSNQERPQPVPLKTPVPRVLKIDQHVAIIHALFCAAGNGKVSQQDLTDAAAAAGMSRPSLNRARKKMGLVKTAYWSLPENAEEYPRYQPPAAGNRSSSTGG